LIYWSMCFLKWRLTQRYNFAPTRHAAAYLYRYISISSCENRRQLENTYWVACFALCTIWLHVSVGFVEYGWLIHTRMWAYVYNMYKYVISCKTGLSSPLRYYLRFVFRVVAHCSGFNNGRLLFEWGSKKKAKQSWILLWYHCALVALRLGLDLPTFVPDVFFTFSFKFK
jgi:hypothetical protein